MTVHFSSRRDVLRGFLGFAAVSCAGLGAGRALAGSEALVSEAAISGLTSWSLIDVATGTVLEAGHPDLALPPASTIKAITSAYALERLGSDFRFVTRVLYDGQRLVLAGYGDPVLDSDALAALAKQVAASGIASPQEFIVSPVWPARQIPQITSGQADYLPYNPTISGMNLNFNRVHMDWRSGGQGLSLQARGTKVSPRAYTVGISAVSRSGPLFSYRSGEKREEWTVASGALRQPGSRWLPVRQPALYAGDVFQTLARAQGLVLPNPVVGQGNLNATEIARHESAPLGQIIVDMMDYSTNLTAEIIGLRASGQADLASSAARMADWARSRGAGGGFVFRDHSGLSPGSLVTSAMMAGLLAGYGRQGGLMQRMKPAEAIDRAGKKTVWPSGMTVMAKTGTLNFVSNLAGYLEGANGRLMAFSIQSADMPKRRATEGQELPAGVLTWTGRAKHLQTALLSSWAAKYGAA